MTKTASKSTEHWYGKPHWAALVVVLALLASYGLASRALETGSLQQYALAIAALWLGLNRVAHLFILSYRKVRA